MPEPAERLMDVDAFLEWAWHRDGAYELHDGRPVAMSPERVRHAGTKSETYAALREAIRRSGLPCRAYVDGITVRVRNDRAFVPDVLVVCPAPAPDVVDIDDPLIVVEVLSPSTSEADHNLKLEGYLSLPSLAHYLILDPVRRVVIHHAREDGARAATRILHAGPLRLDPPGLDLTVEDLFEPEAPA
jgi:Uma2 family endonuclease